MFLQKYHDFVEDYNRPINRILTVILLIISLASLYMSYIRFDNYEAIFRYCLAGYTVIFIGYGWSFKGKSHQSFRYLFKNEISEFLLRLLFLSIILINGIYSNSLLLAIVCLLILVAEFSIFGEDNSLLDDWKSGKKLTFFVRVIVLALWFILLLF